jgi:hypothetical protein
MTTKTIASSALRCFGIAAAILAVLGMLAGSLPASVQAIELYPVPGLISYWRLDETSGTTFQDARGVNNAQCTGTACPGFVAGRVKGALRFDGVDDGLTVVDHSSLDWTLGDSFTIELWVNTTQNCLNATTGATDNKVFVGKYRSGTGSTGSWWLGCSSTAEVSNVATFLLRDQNDGSSGSSLELRGTTSINDGQWHHIVAVRDAQAKENHIYVDGVEQASIPTAYDADFTNNSPLAMGYYYDDDDNDPNTPPRRRFAAHATLDEVAIYKTALSEADIQYHYNNGRNGLSYFEYPNGSVVHLPLINR